MQCNDSYTDCKHKSSKNNLVGVIYITYYYMISYRTLVWLCLIGVIGILLIII